MGEQRLSLDRQRGPACELKERARLVCDRRKNEAVVDAMVARRESDERVNVTNERRTYETVR